MAFFENTGKYLVSTDARGVLSGLELGHPFCQFAFFPQSILCSHTHTSLLSQKSLLIMLSSYTLEINMYSDIIINMVTKKINHQ